MRTLLLIAAVTGCSSKAAAPATGSGSAAAPKSASPTTLAATRTIESLTKPERDQLCSEVTTWVETRNTPDDTKKLACQMDGLSAGIASNKAPALCATAMDACMAKPFVQPPKDCSQFEALSACTGLTVGELVAFLEEIAAHQKAGLQHDVCTQLKSGDKMQLANMAVITDFAGTEGPQAKAVLAKCPQKR